MVKTLHGAGHVFIQIRAGIAIGIEIQIRTKNKKPVFPSTLCRAAPFVRQDHRMPEALDLQLRRL